MEPTKAKTTRGPSPAGVQGTTSIALVRPLITALTKAQFDTQPILAKLGLPSDVLPGPEARIPTSALFAFLEEGALLTGDDDFGLHMGENAPLGAAEVLEYAMRASATVGEALRKPGRYSALVVDHANLRLEVLGNLAHLTGPTLEVTRHTHEMCTAFWVGRSRELTGAPFPIVRVDFRHARPRSVKEHERVFGAPVHFNQPVNDVVFPRSFLDEPLRSADPVLAGMLHRYAESLASKLLRPEGFLATARDAVAKALRGRDPSVHATAEQLGMSRRALQRKLTEEGTTHQALVDDIRRELSTRYVADKDIPDAEISYLLGFSQATAFYRAFKRWTGKTPKEFRSATRAT